MMTSPPSPPSPSSRIGWNARPLRTLEAVARLGSVSAAARELGCTQSAASQHLAALERDAGVVLVDRGSRPLRPTPAGAAVLERARVVLDGFAALDATLSDLREATRGVLRVAAFPGAVATFLPPAIRELTRHHPRVTVEVTALEPDDATAALRAGDVDVAVLHRPRGDRPDDGLRRTGLLHDPMRVVVPEGHPLTSRRWIGVTDLSGEPLIVPAVDGPGHAHRALVERLFLDAGVVPGIAFEVDDLAAARALAAAGLGVVLMYALTIPNPHPGLVVRPLRDGDAAARRVEVARLDGRENPAADAMVTLLVTSYTGGD
jgi:DNA-binding transcriptional LysR family regulator